MQKLDIRYVGGKKYRFSLTAREQLEIDELAAQLNFRSISAEEMTEMLDGIPSDKMERAKARLIEANEKAEQVRIEEVKCKLAKWEEFKKVLAERGSSMESMDSYGGWHTTHRG